MAVHALDKWVCRCLTGERGYPSAIGLPGASFKDGRWYLRRHTYIDGNGSEVHISQGAGAFQVGWSFFRECQLGPSGCGSSQVDAAFLENHTWRTLGPPAAPCPQAQLLCVHFGCFN